MKSFWISLFVFALGATLLFGVGQEATGEVARQATGTPCPVPTPEWLAVDPVISPTDAFTQSIGIVLHNGDAVTVTLESGVFTDTGSTPYQVVVPLLPNTTHHLTVRGHVRPVNVGGCMYGNYTLTTTRDRHGNPLIIEQRFAPDFDLFLPLIVK